jgi:hypothetical protein
MIWLIGTLTSLGWCMIGRWTLSPLSSMFCIPLEWVGRVHFEVKSFYKALHPNIDSPFPWKSIWRIKIPLRLVFLTWTASLGKMVFLTWTASLGKILTLDNLCKCHIIVIDWCCMCKKSGKTSDHLRFHCDVLRELWIIIFFIVMF